MLPHRMVQGVCQLDVDGDWMDFSKAPECIKASTHVFHTLFESDENSWGTMVTLRATRISATKETFPDLESLPSKEDIVPRQHEVSAHCYQRVGDRILAPLNAHTSLELYKPLCLSLPINDDVKTLFTSLSTWSTNQYLVTRVIQCPPDPRWPGSSTSTTSFCTFVKPFIWRRNVGADSVSEEGPDDKTMSDQASVSDGDGMEL